MGMEGIAEVNGTRLFYEVAGEGYPVVFVHGFSLDTRMWDRQFEEFARYYKVVRYDVRGYGRSDVPGREGYYHADDLLGLIDFLGCEKTHLVGLSLGAAIVAEFAVAYPERVSAIVLADPVIWGYEWSAEYNASLSALWSQASVEAAKAMWLAHPMFAAAMEKQEVWERLVEIIGEYSGWHWTRNDPGLLPERRAFERLEEIGAPTLAIVGERDVADFHVITGSLAARVPNARKVVLPGAGHMSNMEEPDEFDQIVSGFLNAL